MAVGTGEGGGGAMVVGTGGALPYYLLSSTVCIRILAT